MAEKGSPKQKLYDYVDESGQDIKSAFFVVVALVSAENQEVLRKKLLKVERLVGTGNKKWRKVRPVNRLKYLKTLLEKEIAKGNIFMVITKGLCGWN